MSSFEYKIVDGVLHKNGKPAFAIGESYYPSFHEAKYPVPPEGDRIGEMKKDLRLMAEMGFNHVRYAAIGSTYLDGDGKVVVDTPFVDAMIREAEKNGISVSVRLQGYAMNLHGYDDVLMINSKGELQDINRWFDFIRTTLHHEGMREDNRLATAALAKHYSEFPGVVAFQIYNEPHYPASDFFDYHPNAIAAFRVWLVKKGIMTEEQARDYMPPRTRKEKSPEEWANWRLFGMESLCEFIADSSDASKSASDLPTYTCLTTHQTSSSNACELVDNFGTPRSSLDIHGYTNYICGEGEDFYGLLLAADLVATSAALAGKKSWCIELDSRTKIPLRIFNKNTYATLSSGVKGIVYYQWRGDYPSPATPIPNGCGLVNYDGSHVPNYDNAARMVRLLNDLSDELVGAKRQNHRVAILHSDYSQLCYDAIENYDEIGAKALTNTQADDLIEMYRDLVRASYTVNVVDEQGLIGNPLGIKALFIAGCRKLSESERAAVETFVNSGGSAYIMGCEYQRGCHGYYPYGTNRALYVNYMQFDDVLEELRETVGLPETMSDNPRVSVRALDGDGYKIITLVNISCPHKPQNCKIKCSFPIKEATLYTNTSEPVALAPKDGELSLVVDDGGIIVVR